MLTSSEDREHERSPVKLEAQLRLLSRVLVEGEVHNLSLSGAWFVTERSLPLGNRVRVDLVAERDGLSQRIVADGVVARIGEGGVAVQFIDIDAATAELIREIGGAIGAAKLHETSGAGLSHPSPGTQ